MRNSPARTADSRFRFVAATTRTLAWTGEPPPTRSKGCPSRTRQEFGLDRRAHLSDFVQKERAAVRQFEFALLLLRGAGEGSTLVAEQFAFQQTLAQRGAVQADERPVVTRAHGVDGRGDELLADATLSADQRGGTGRGDATDMFPQGPHRGAVADQFRGIAAGLRRPSRTAGPALNGRRALLGRGGLGGGRLGGRCLV